MIVLEEVIARWSAAFTDQDMINAAPAHELRERMQQAVDDVHDLAKLASTVREYGKARIALSKAHEAWVAANKPDESTAPKLLAWLEARAKHRAAIDRLEAVAVQLAGGDVRKVCQGEAANG